MSAGSKKRKVPASPQTPRVGPAQPAQQTGGSTLFQGCRFMFLQRAHMQRMIERVRELGGAVDDEITTHTTHAVCKPDAVVEQVAEKLKACPPGRSCVMLAVRGDATLQVPQGLCCVTPDFITNTILRKARQREADYLPPALQPAQQQSCSPSVEAQQQQQQQQQQRRAAASWAGESPRRQGSSSTVPFTSGQLAEILQDTGGVAAAAAPKQAAPQQGEEGEEGEPCVVERRGAEFVCVRGRKPRFTGGNTTIPWGSFGVWDEPYDETSARATVEKLRSFWYQTEAPPAVSPEPGPKAGNGVCTHVSCSKRPFCLVDKLSAVKQVYVPGRDQFRIKALDKAVSQLIQYPCPLDTAQDVDAAGLGPKTAEKVKEILSRGESSRLEALARDPQREVLSAFTEVWGAGPGTAMRWYSAGCRTLDDVRSRDDLTLQQKVGLKYYDDLKHRIPRGESAVAEGMVRRAVFELCEGRGARDVERTYAFVAGSYIRGSPDSSDIDILVCLPPSLTGQDCGLFLTQLLGKLLDGGLLVDEMSPRHLHTPSVVRASWMGICRPPDSPCFRRIDVKVYGHMHTPFAVNYFANSMSFCRATRHWANHAVQEAAQQYNPAATGFKLSDKEMVPRAKHTVGRGRGGGGRAGGTSGSDSEHGGEKLLGPAVECRCETDIFHVLGLAYVPPTMRYFHNFA